MTTSPFKTSVTRQDLLIGTLQTLPSPEITEVLCSAGFDWLFVDLEHGAMGIGDAQTILQAAAPQMPCLLRVPVNDETWIKKALDIGAAGIIVPQVRTAEEAQQAVRCCRYPPEGLRSVGIARAHGYGERFQDYMASANDAIVVVIQIEHVDALAHLPAILDVTGVDAIFVGPYDLAASMGKMGRPDDADVVAAIGRVTTGAGKKDVPLGIFGATADAVKPYIDQGYSLIAVGMDTLLLSRAARDIHAGLK